jgi:hypothetical protein
MLMNINQHIARFSARTKTTPTNLNNYPLTKWLSGVSLKGLTIMKKLNKQTVTLTTTLLLSIGILLSGNAFAKDDSLKDFVTQIELETAINDIELTPGDTGAVGAQGPIGATGADGAQGPTGATGADGAQGPIGDTGADGERGLIGQTGFNGVDGVDGTSVPDGALDGDTLVWNAIDRTWDPTAAASSTLAIGDLYQGGKVFWLDASGQHGLIAALADQTPVDSGLQWYNRTYRDTGATGNGLYAGAMNTAMIVATQVSDTLGVNFAAKLAADYSVQADGVSPCTLSYGSSHPPVDEICYGDWYLPSKVELNLLYQNKNIAVVGGFSVNYYWSSTEYDSGNAWGQDFFDGYQFYRSKGTTTIRVRAVRAF